MKNITQLNNIYTILNTLQIEEYNDIYKTEEEPYTIKYSEVQELIDKYDLNPLFLTQFKRILIANAISILLSIKVWAS